MPRRLALLLAWHSPLDTVHWTVPWDTITKRVWVQRWQHRAWHETSCESRARFQAGSATTEALERSIAQLGVGYVDLMLLHYPASWSGVGGPSMRKEAWLAMEEWARRTGKAKALGVSHYCKRHLEDVFSVAREPVALNQVQYHVGMGPQSGINASLRHDPAYDHAHGVVYAAYSSLCGPCPAPDNKALITGPLVTRIGAAHGKSGPQVALRWAVQRGIPVIPKSTHAAHLKQNLDLFSWSLSSEEMDELDRAQTPVETGTPPQPKDDAQDCLVP